MTGAATSAAVWQRFCSVGGITTEVLGISASSGFPRLQVVVFPGNPGSAAFFKPFMRAVHSQLRGQADVLAVTHAGHDPDTDHGGRLWDLSQQIAHKVSFLREHVLLPGRPPVLMVGHSIGAAMMIKAVADIEGLSAADHLQQQQQQPQQQQVEEEEKELGQTHPLAAGPPDGARAVRAAGAAAAGVAAGEKLPPIVKLVAVFPFFETNFGGNWRQRRLRALAPWYEAMGWVGAAVASLPWSLRLAFVRLNAGMDADASALTARLLARHPVRNAFYLASHEFKDLSRPWDWGLMAALGARLHVMGCAADTWLSRQQYDDMLQRVPGLQASWHPDLRHAFCASERQSTAVSETVAAVAASIPEMDLDLHTGVDAGPDMAAGDLDLGLSYRSRPASAASVSRADSSETTSSAASDGDAAEGETTFSEACVQRSHECQL